MTSRRVEWDEKNLAANEEWQKAHPVTMHIDEPKTPYVHIDDETAAAMDAETGTWDPKVNANVKDMAERIYNSFNVPTSTAPVSASGRPMLSEHVVSGKASEECREQQFKALRKALYADEGNRFKELLGKKKELKDDSDT